MINYLDENASKIFIGIIDIGKEQSEFTLISKDGSSKQLTIKRVGTIRLKAKILDKFSFGWFYEENGKILADPEMIFLYNPEYPHLIAPCFFRMDGLGKFEDSIRFNKKNVAVDIKPKMQHGHTVFANVWINTISQLYL